MSRFAPTTGPHTGHATDFAQWIVSNPPPDLQKLVKEYGTYSAITEDAWRKHLAAQKDWELRRRDRFWR